MGVPFVEDTNDPNQPVSAITKLRTTVTVDGKRCSTYEAFLPATFVQRHPNLKICFGAVAQRLDVVSHEGNHKVEAVFIENEKSDGQTYYVKAKEIISCSGAVGSAQLLLLRLFSPYHFI